MSFTISLLSIGPMLHVDFKNGHVPVSILGVKGPPIGRGMHKGGVILKQYRLFTGHMEGGWGGLYFGCCW